MKEEWLTAMEGAKRFNITEATIYNRIKHGQFKKVKVQPTVTTNGVRKTKMIHISEFENLKKEPQGLIPRVRAYIKKEPQEIDAPSDFDMTFLDNFVVDKGKHTFAAHIKAIEMLSLRKKFSDIEEETGMTKMAVVGFVKELQEARKEEPKKYKSVMDYLNAGRPYHPKHRDMLNQK